MQRAWYPYQIIDSILFQKTTDFIIANTENKPTNFISSEEKVYRRLATRNVFDEDFFNEIKDPNSNETYESSLQYWDSLADNEHIIANGMNMAVWIQNSSNDTILLPEQDGSLIGILEAMDTNNDWKAVEYWWFSWCGNSYMNLNLPPEHSIQIGINNNRGDWQTKMRLKIHGQDTIYFSNEFVGSVSKNDFFLTSETKKEMMYDKYRISFLDSIRYGLIDDSEIEFVEFEE